MTLLSMVNNAQDILSLPRSTVVISSTDQNVRLLLALANQEGRQLAKRYTWEALLTEQTFTSVATEVQTNADLTDVERFINGSLFNRTRKRRVTGPLNPREWQAQQALSASLLTDAFRVYQGSIYITPAPTAGDTYAFEYVTNKWCQSSGSVGQAAWAADDDTGVIDEFLMELGLIWRFRKARGFDYAEEFASYQEQVTQAEMRDGGGERVLNFSHDVSLYDHAKPPLVIEGSWNL